MHPYGIQSLIAWVTVYDRLRALIPAHCSPTRHHLFRFRTLGSRVRYSKVELILDSCTSTPYNSLSEVPCKVLILVNSDRFDFTKTNLKKAKREDLPLSFLIRGVLQLLGTETLSTHCLISWILSRICPRKSGKKLCPESPMMPRDCDGIKPKPWQGAGWGFIHKFLVLLFLLTSKSNPSPKSWVGGKLLASRGLPSRTIVPANPFGLLYSRTSL